MCVCVCVCAQLFQHECKVGFIDPKTIIKNPFPSVLWLGGEEEEEEEGLRQTAT